MEFRLCPVQSLEQAGVWGQVLTALGGDPDLNELLMDSTIVRAHQHAAGATRGSQKEAIGRSRGGLTTKVHAAVSGQGRAVRLVLTGGERHDLIAAPLLLEGLSVRNVIGDKGYDSDPLREQIRRQGGHPVIPSRTGHRNRRHDKEKYKLRNVIERFFNRLKHCRRVATRYDKTARNYFSFVCIGAAMITF